VRSTGLIEQDTKLSVPWCATVGGTSPAIARIACRRFDALRAGREIAIQVYFPAGMITGTRRRPLWR
jgi:hypothetical protein